MFDGVPDQFHQFIASRTSLPLPLSFPLHGSSPTFPSFDPYTSHQTIQPHLLHQLHHQSTNNKGDEDQKQENTLLSTNLQLQRETLISEPIDPWSNDEVLALLRIRSSVENWFPEFIWEHVSRKLAELGFTRSAEKCKEKFEEESRNFNTINYHKNYRIFSELEELYPVENPQISAEKNQNMENPNDEQIKMRHSFEENPRTETVLRNPSQENEEVVEKSTKSKKRKRKHKLEMFKGFCVDVVNTMISQQEELHNKLLEDMVKREEDKIAREEAWKKQEMDWINKEIEIRAHEQAISSDRQANIIEFLKKYTSSSENECFERRLDCEDILNLPPNSLISPTSPSLLQLQNPNSSTCQLSNQNKLEAATSSTMVVSQNNPSSSTTQNKTDIPSLLSDSTLAPKNPSSIPSSTNKVPQNPNASSNEKDNLGKRWPKDEVSALINVRCSLLPSNGEDKEGSKGPLWERISQAMLELGYKRSAKRCKEKWENINKYFRKTKDVNKKRPIDSRTCPYFHQLNSLYSQGTLVAPIEGPVNRLPENHSAVLANQLIDSQGGSGDANMQVAGGENNFIPVPDFNF